jgi:hypothetical protein
MSTERELLEYLEFSRRAASSRGYWYARLSLDELTTLIRWGNGIFDRRKTDE